MNATAAGAGNATATARIGVDLGGTKIEVIVLDAGGQTQWRRRAATPRGDYARTVRELAALVRTAERETGCRGSVGVGIPGTLSSLTGRVKNANSVWLNDRALQHDLSAALEREVRVANDANCFAMSEATDGAGAGAASVMGVILGTGVGAGLVLDGRLVEGCNGIAGEWGHNRLPSLDQLGPRADRLPQSARMRADESPGPACYCGRFGCVETWLSGPGLAADHARSAGHRKAVHPSPVSGASGADTSGAGASGVGAPVADGPAADGPALNARHVIEAMRAGDVLAGLAFERYLDRLARGLAMVINVLDPHVIVLGGGLSQVDELYERLPPRLSAYVFSDDVRTRIVCNRHGDSSGVRGAAWLWSPEPADTMIEPVGDSRAQPPS